MKKRWRWALVVIFTAIGGAIFTWSNLSGDPLPAPDKVDQVIATGDFGPGGAPVTFEIPVEGWPRIRAAMQPAARDFSPATWIGIGSLDVTTRQGRKYRVDLFRTQEPPGAFSVGPTFERRVYYRGGDSKELA